MSRRVLITGASGYLGAAAVLDAANRGDTHVVGIWRSGRSRLLAEPPANVRYVQCDLSDGATLRRLFDQSRYDAVVHAAALLPDGQPDYLSRAVRSNVLATAHLVEVAAQSGCRRFVYCSSIGVYGDSPASHGGWREDDRPAPSDIYGWSKFAGEELLRLRASVGDLTGISLRLAGIHGGDRRSGVAFHLTRAALSGAPLTVNDPDTPFQILFLADAVAAVRRAIDAPVDVPHRAVNIASHVFPSMEDMARRIVETCRSSSAIARGRCSGLGPQIMNIAGSEALGFRPLAADQQLERLRDALREDLR